MDKQRYDEIDETFKPGILLTMSSVLLLVLTLLILIVLHAIIWSGNVRSINSNELILVIIEFIMLTLLHEFVHAVTYIKLGKLQRSNVKLRIHLPKTISVHLTEIVPINVRRWTIIMPTLLICPLLLLIGLGTNNLSQTAIAGVMLIGGVIDIYENLKLMKYKSDCFVEDKINFSGCIVYKPKE